MGLLFAACAAATDSTSSAGGPIDAGVPASKGLWHVVGQQALAATATSEPFALTPQTGVRSILVRGQLAPPLAQDGLCLRLTDLQTAQGQPWSDPNGACPGCAQAPGSGFAQALWAANELPADGLHLRVQVVACHSAQPVALAALSTAGPYTFSLLTWHAPVLPAGQGMVSLRFAYAASATPADRAAWAKPIAHAVSLLESAGLQVTVRAPLVLPVGAIAAPLQLGLGHAGDERKLESAVVAALNEAAPIGSHADANLDVVVAVAPCLDWTGVDGVPLRLLGHSTRMPGGPRGPDGASLVVVGTSNCQAPGAGDATRLGNVLAHEIGHFLGLGHDAAQPPSLMTADVADRGGAALSFTVQQAARMRLNPVVAAP